MRSFARLSLAFLVAALAAGPALAAPVVPVHAPAFSAPIAPQHHPAPLADQLTAPLGMAMSIRVKDVGSSAKKFVQRAQAAGADYTDGVKQAGSDWETNTRAAEDNYAAGVQQAIGNKMFGKGVAAAGAAKYTAKASTLGAQRYPQGVAASEGAYSQGVAPYLQTIASLNLPARRPKGDPANMQRANTVAAALRAQRVGK